ncbi:MAG: sigma-70 family RNA polymerase sigma factor [Patulibacter sp.]
MAWGRRERHDGELRRVYDDHVAAVYAFLAYSVGRDTAEDLTATTFERVIRHWHRYDAARASERTWILAIARNALTDHYRRNARRQSDSIDDPLIAATLGEHDSNLARVLSRGLLKTVLEQLGERERSVLALRYGADLSAREIGELLELSEANVHQITSRSLRKLRETIGERPET